MPSLRALLRHPPLRRTAFIAGSLASWIPAWLFYQDNVFQVMTVTGASMYPFLNPDFHSSATTRTSVLVDMRRPWEELHRGSVITFWSPFNPETLVVKRVVALEGDEVATKGPYPFPSEVVPFGHVWVEGENPDGRKSLDSNTYGPVKKNLIVGKLKAVVWPWSQASWIQWQDYRGSPRVIRDKYPVDSVQTFRE